jgi:hypothetical protein
MLTTKLLLVVNQEETDNSQKYSIVILTGQVQPTMNVTMKLVVQALMVMAVIYLNIMRRLILPPIIDADLKLHVLIQVTN